MIINSKKGKTIGSIQKIKQICLINHLIKITLYCALKKESSEIANCSLFSKEGNLLECVYTIHNNIQEVKSVFYNKINFHIYFNVFENLSQKI